MSLVVNEQMKEKVQSFEKNFKPITVYLRNKRNDRLIGCLTGFSTSESNKIMIGWSKCNLKLDKFDKIFAKYLAFKRASTTLDLESMPREIRLSIDGFRSRLKKYYKKES